MHEGWEHSRRFFLKKFIDEHWASNGLSGLTDECLRDVVKDLAQINLVVREMECQDCLEHQLNVVDTDASRSTVWHRGTGSGRRIFPKDLIMQSYGDTFRDCRVRYVPDCRVNRINIYVQFTLSVELLLPLRFIKIKFFQRLFCAFCCFLCSLYFCCTIKIFEYIYIWFFHQRLITSQLHDVLQLEIFVEPAQF